MAIQFNENEVCQLINAVRWYRDFVTGSDDIWDRYEHLCDKLIKYGEEASPMPLSCTLTRDE